MKKTSWNDYRDAEAKEDRLWELYHENSKVSPFTPSPSNEAVLRWMTDQYDQFEFESRQETALPAPHTSDMPLGLAIRQRRTPQDFSRSVLSLGNISTILFQGAGITRSTEQDSRFPRPFRAAPSAGAMYPIDLFIHVSGAAQIDDGIYHYNAHQHSLVTIKPGNCARELASALVQPHLAQSSGMVVMMAATFERATQKYRERGFRFALIESGHIAQNMLLSATAIGMAGIPLGGYYDRQVDALLDLDGVTHSVVYCVAIGTPRSAALPDIA